MRRAFLIAALSIGLVAAVLPTAAIAGHPNDHVALLVGLDHFLGRTRPNFGSLGDVNDMQMLLLQRGWRPERIRVLTDSGARAADIRSGLQWLVDNCEERSWCVFHYSGHVKQMNKDRDRDGEAVDEFLWPYDNQFISDGELAGYLRQLRGYALISISGCEAAGFDDGVSSPRRLFVASSQEPEKSYEYPAWSNTVFTGLMVDQATLQRQGDADRNGRTSFDEAFRYASERAPQMTSGQKKGPQHPYRAGGSEVPDLFDPPRPPPPPPAPAAAPKTCLLFICL